MSGDTIWCEPNIHASKRGVKKAIKIQSPCDGCAQDKNCSHRRLACTPFRQWVSGESVANELRLASREIYNELFNK